MAPFCPEVADSEEEEEEGSKTEEEVVVLLTGNEIPRRKIARARRDGLLKGGYTR